MWRKSLINASKAKNSPLPFLVSEGEEDDENEDEEDELENQENQVSCSSEDVTGATLHKVHLCQQ